jgi:curli biogenesis system outer membrane secretion channel CsgG
MNKIVRNSLLSVVAVTFITGCGKNEIDIAAYPTKINNMVQVPDVCLPQYKSAMPTVAVIDFTNNSTFGKADIANSNSRRDSAAIVGVGVGPTGFVAGGASTSNTTSHSENRSVDAKLAESLTSPIETLIVNSGGAKLLSRADMSKIDAELKFQDSGLVDPASVAKFGKLSGAKYIVTGSIDNVEQKYRDNSGAAKAAGDATKNSDNNAVKLIGFLLQAGASVTDGMVITSTMTVKIIDVETGQIVMTKALEKSANIGKIRNPNYDQIVGGIKTAMLEALPDLEADFADYFSVKGYITQLKAKDKEVVAQVNIGRDLKVVENQIFKALNFDALTDPMTGKESCDVSVSAVKLRATQQITPNTTWATIEEGDGTTLKVGQLVQKTHEKAGFGIPKF